MVGTQLSHYRVLDKLGEGGMGAVYRAEDTRLGRQVALKLLPELKTADLEARKRFLAEARAASALEHPNICTLYEFDEADGQPFIAMQLVEGETLKQAITRAPLSEERTRDVVCAVARALTAAHAKGIVHRDVKSENILLGKDGSIVLTDFGIARLTQGETLTATDAMIGTPAYMAPEQVRGERATPASDQFSLAAVTYECLTGAPPFPGDNLGALVHAILNVEPAPPSKRHAGIDSGWDAAVMTALAKQASQRHASMSEFAEAVAATAPSGPRPTEGGEAMRSIAVLYFENMSNDPESDYFCAGITEDLLTDLSKINGLEVASRNAVARYRGQTVDIPKVGRELGVASVLEGSVRKAGNRVRINAQLIRTASGFHVWAERYDRTLDDIFAVQDDITAAIAGALRSKLSAQEVQSLRADRPNDVRAYDLYLKGHAYYELYEVDAMHRAVEAFEGALKIEPAYAMAWAGLASACGQMHDKAFDLDPAWIERGKKAARRAIELSPDLAEAYKAMSLVLGIAGEREASLQSLHKALQLDPRHVGALTNLGVARVERGDLAGGERALRRVMAIDPALSYAPLLLSWILLYTRRFREAQEMSYRVQRVASGSVYHMLMHAVRIIARKNLGDMEGARSEIETARNVGLGEQAIRAAEAYVDGRLSTEVLGPRTEGIEATSWSIWLGFEVSGAAAAGSAARMVEALKIAERHDPHTWTSFPVVVRLNPETGRVAKSPELLGWLGDRGGRIVWATEAPKLPDEVRAQFTDYSEASGIPGDEAIP